MSRWLNKYILPSEDNNFLPYVMRENSIFMLMIALCGLFALSFLGSALVERTSFHAEVRSALLIEYANETRVKQELKSLTMNSALEQAAQLKANDMAEQGYFDHVNPQGLVPWHWFSQAGYSFRFAGENLAVNFDDSDEVHDAWLDSPSHRANILNAQFSEVGIATAEGEYRGEQATFVVQMFGTPKITYSDSLLVDSSNLSESNNLLGINNLSENNSLLESFYSETSSTPQAVTSTPVTALLSESDLETEKVIIVSEQGDFVLGASVTNKIDEERVRALMVNKSTEKPTLLMSTLARPAHVAHIVYIALIGLIALALVIMISVHPKKQHPTHIIYGALLLVLAVGFMVANKMLFDTPINLL